MARVESGLLFYGVEFLRLLFRYVCRHYFRTILAIIVAAVAASVGLRSDRWLEASLNLLPYKTFVIPTPSPDYISALDQLFLSAKTEILFAAPKIDTEEVLLAAQAAEKRNVRVVFVFSPEAVSTKTGCLGWLLYHQVGEVFTDNVSFAGTTVVVDGRVAMLSAVPVTIKTRAAAAGGRVVVIKNADGASQLKTSIMEQIRRGTAYREDKP
jgi:hypothetical protein